MRHPSRPSDPTIVNEADPRLDHFYEGLVDRARFLLAYAGARTGNVHAHQIFEPAKRYSVQEIADRFREAGWHKLIQVNTVKRLFDEVREALYSKLRQSMDEIESLIDVPGLDKELVRETRREIADDLASLNFEFEDPEPDSDRKTSQLLLVYDILVRCSWDNLFEHRLIRKRSEIDPSFFVGPFSPRGTSRFRYQQNLARFHEIKTAH